MWFVDVLTALFSNYTSAKLETSARDNKFTIIDTKIIQCIKHLNQL